MHAPFRASSLALGTRLGGGTHMAMVKKTINWIGRVTRLAALSSVVWIAGAAHAVVRSAGGRVDTLKGEPLSYANPAEKLNPYFVVWGH